MTIPSERTRAILFTEEFLKDLIDPKKTPRIPSDIRARARQLLRHYPTPFEIELVCELEEKHTDAMRYKVFG